MCGPSDGVRGGKKGGKEEIFTVLAGKNMRFEKEGGGGQKYQLF